MRFLSIRSSGWWAVLLITLLGSGCGLFRSESPMEPVFPLPPAPPLPGSTTTDTLSHHPTQTPTPTLTPLPTQDEDPVVLQVNGVQIRLSEYQEGLRDYLRTNGEGTYSAGAEEYYRQHLIDDLLLLNYGKRVGADQEADYRRRLQRLQHQLLIEYVRRTRVVSQVEVSEADIRKYYEEHGADFASPRMVQVRAIQTNNFRDAELVLEKVRANPQDFHDLAQEYSIHPSRSRGGELEPFSRDTYAKPFEDVAFDLQIGEISPVIATEQGYFILEKLGEIPEQRPPLAEVRSQIEDLLRAQKEDEALRNFLAGLRQYATIETHWPTNGMNGGGR